jgi:hypothetical protein
MPKSAVPLALIFCAVCFAAAPAIGTMSGTGDLFDGTAIHTAVAPNDVNLASGVAIRLSPRSEGTVFHDHLVLDQGAVRVENFKDYQIDARDLQIQAAEPTAGAVVRITDKTIEVASVRGALNVSDGGAMLTRVTAGTHISFRQAGAAGGPSRKALPSDTHVMTWMIGITAAAALAIGLTAAAQGKSPF